MISAQEYVNRARAWKQVFTRCQSEALRNLNGGTATLNIDTSDCEQLVSIMERVEELEFPRRFVEAGRDK